MMDALPELIPGGAGRRVLCLLAEEPVVAALLTGAERVVAPIQPALSLLRSRQYLAQLAEQFAPLSLLLALVSRFHFVLSCHDRFLLSA